VPSASGELVGIVKIETSSRSTLISAERFRMDDRPQLRTAAINAQKDAGDIKFDVMCVLRDTRHVALDRYTIHARGKQDCLIRIQSQWRENRG
jgi:hypothetical protein